MINDELDVVFTRAAGLDMHKSRPPRRCESVSRAKLRSAARRVASVRCPAVSYCWFSGWSSIGWRSPPYEHQFDLLRTSPGIS